jgi:hypothetical protein
MNYGPLVELADTADLRPATERYEGSTPSGTTMSTFKINIANILVITQDFNSRADAIRETEKRYGLPVYTIERLDQSYEKVYRP